MVGERTRSDGRHGREAWIVVDLGFGDAGKGTLTDYLARARGARTVVRFNGGAQAGHNVVAPDGRHHTFAQFGAASFVPGVRTHLARQMVVHPLALRAEARHLAAVGVGDAMARLTVSEQALVITPFHQSANRLRELARGDARHGSCGVGVGEAVGDALAHGDDEVVRMRDLCGPRAALRARLARVQARKRAELDEPLRALAGDARAEPERRALLDPRLADAWIDALAPLDARAIVVDDGHLARALRAAPGAVVFEGAQGVLLDEWRGFHPYTTWSTCTFDNALALLREAGYDGAVTRLGVLRTYATRHGPGPLPSESRELARALREPHNPHGAWQGAFRAGWLDLALAAYAVAACGGVDALALTHADALARVPRWRVCRGYRVAPADAALFERAGADVVAAPRLGPLRDLDHQAALGRALLTAEPVLDDVPPAALRDHAEGYVRMIERTLGARAAIVSSGPRASDKRERGARASSAA